MVELPQGQLQFRSEPFCAYIVSQIAMCESLAQRPLSLKLGQFSCLGSNSLAKVRKSEPIFDKIKYSR